MSGLTSKLIFKSEIFKNLSLHIDDVEFLQNAFIVQSLVGPLVRFSNRGRYEPYVAQSWVQSGSSWIFKLHPGLTCEDGERIDAVSFRQSLLRSLRRFSMQELSETPFRELVGAKEFIATGDDSNIGITASANELELKFANPTGKSLLEYLAMTPFAYLCAANFKNNEWASNQKFISSGPYRVSKFSRDTSECTIELRPEWPLSQKKAFRTVLLTENDSKNLSPKIEMTYGEPKSAVGQSNLVLEVPRALLSVRLGTAPGRFFAKGNNRKVLQTVINRALNNTQIPFLNYHRAETIFFGQVSGHEVRPSFVSEVEEKPTKALQIRGQTRGVRPEVDFYQGILFAALDELGWDYELNFRPILTASDFHAQNFDIAFDRSHVDATLDPDFVRMLFKSKLGPQFPDPGSSISKLIEDFDNGGLSYRDFLVSFNSTIAEQSAILPLFHRGFVWIFSPEIDTHSINPMMSILKFDELELVNDVGT